LLTFELPNVVVITGTASGLGRSLIALCQEAGSDVIGIDVRPASEGLSGDWYLHIRSSVDDPHTWDQVRQQLTNRPKTDTVGFASVAAILVQGTAEQVSVESWQRILAVNVIGPALGLATIAPLMITRGGGSVVMVGSVNATFGEESLLAYNASKGALRQVVRTAALDYGKYQVRINMVSPGPMETEMFLTHLRASDDPAAFRTSRENRQPLGRILQPDEVANAIAFLLSNGSTGITGTDLIVDGGLTAGFEYRNIAMHGAEG
jgi:NAD(P)-dependent dehydrogenase (short-subunit alcohol dehydrogenase family)